MPDVRLPSAWERTSLAGLAEYLNGFAFNESYWSAEGLPIVRIAQITGSQGIVDRYQGPLPDTYRLDDGDLIFSWSGTLAVVRWNGGPAWLNQHLFKVVPRHGIDRDLLFHLLQASVVEMNKRTHGSTMKHIKRGELREFSVSLPVDAAEQRALAEILDTLDTTIRQTEAIIEKLKQVKQGLLHDLLTRGIDANGELRPPQSQAPHLYKDSPLGWIPREWRCDALDDAVRIIDCKHITPTYVEQGYPVVRPRNVKVDGLDLVNVEFVTASDFAAMTDVHAPRRGDIVLSRNASFGVPAFVDTDRPFAIGQDVIVMTRTLSNTRFLFYCLQSSLLSKQIDQRSAGSTFGRINLSDIRALFVPSPDLSEQTAIATRLRSVDERIESEEQGAAKLRTMKSGLMDDLLTGRVRVTPLLPAAAA
jgi:type I restriction enzyme S subunit